METVPMTPAMIAKAQMKLLLAQTAQKEFLAYIEGCMTGMGLDGDYNLDTQKWVFVPRPKSEEVK